MGEMDAMRETMKTLRGDSAARRRGSNTAKGSWVWSLSVLCLSQGPAG